MKLTENIGLYTSAGTMGKRPALSEEARKGVLDIVAELNQQAAARESLEQGIRANPLAMQMLALFLRNDERGQNTLIQIAKIQALYPRGKV